MKRKIYKIISVSCIFFIYFICIILAKNGHLLSSIILGVCLTIVIGINFDTLFLLK